MTEDILLCRVVKTALKVATSKVVYFEFLKLATKATSFQQISKKKISRLA